ncbi:MAG: T9SS type A sorting domain-containing protein, partial [Proteobacteria bacterium]|nr:T9SS type A sorting domain-containing protein [Pseudomonadota bacterium]
PSSGVNITVTPNDNNGQGSGTTQFTRTYNNNTTVTLTAPSTVSGNNFQKWQRGGVDYSTSLTTTVTMDANYTMTAVYVTPPSPRISGYVRDGSSNPISDVTITFSNSGGATTTNSSGYYEKTVTSGWSGTATPSKTGWTFSPTNRPYTNVTTDQTNQNYTGTPPTNPKISGYVKESNNNPVVGVTMTFSNSGGTTTTNSSGYYENTVNSGWSGSATPSKSGYLFSPTSRPYSNVTSDQTNQNYTGTPCSITWQSNIILSDGCAGTNTLTFGRAPCATDDIDSNLGESELPPPPPSGLFDARFVLPNPYSSKSSLKDFRDDVGNTKTWRMTFQPGLCGYPITFNWNNSSLPTGSFFLKDEVTGSIINVNMKTQNSYTLTNTGINSLKIEFSAISCKDVAVNSGWNIISVPLLAADMSVSSLFPGAASSAYGYNLGYTIATTLTNGKGYWLKFNSANTFNICGSIVTPKTISVNSGWNMIGPFESDVQTTSIATSPSGIIASSFYGYNNGYTTATTLQVGKGYWVKASQAGTLNLPSGPAKTSDTNQQPAEINSFWSRIEVEDINGNRGSLYFAPGTESTQQYELPPIPPLGIFDVRFASDKKVESIDKGSYEVQINSALYPIKLRIYNFDCQSLRVKDLFGGKLVDEILQEGGELLITKGLERIMIEKYKLPNKFELSQNYPNPFNPTTIIKFSISESAKVKLEVYNMLGQKLKELINSTLEAGYQQIEFSADGLSSGLYIYKLTVVPNNDDGITPSNGFSFVKKMLVLK